MEIKFGDVKITIPSKVFFGKPNPDFFNGFFKMAQSSFKNNLEQQIKMMEKRINMGK